jgi:HEAT repeat protein
MLPESFPPRRADRDGCEIPRQRRGSRAAFLGVILLSSFALPLDRAWAQSSAEKLVAGFAQKLSSRDVKVRQKAALTLGMLRNPAAVPHLVRALHDDDWLVRAYAADGLKNLGPAAATTAPDLVHALRDPNRDVRLVAGAALQSIGPAAIHDVTALLNDPAADADVRRRAAEILKVIVPKSEGGDRDAAVAALLAALNDAQVHGPAADALGEIPDRQDVVSSLITASTASEYNASAIAALGRIGRVTQNEDIRNQILSALLKSLTNVNQMERHNGSRISENTADALKMIGPRAVGVLGRALSDGTLDEDTRGDAAFVLGRFEPPEKDAVPYLVAVLKLKDPSSYVRAQAADALGSIGPLARDDLPTLLKTLSDTDEAVRVAAASALGSVVEGGDAHEINEVLDGLKALANDPAVQNGLTPALEKIGPEIRNRARELFTARDERQKAIESLTSIEDALKDRTPDTIHWALDRLDRLQGEDWWDPVLAWLRANKTVAGVFLYVFSLSSLWLALLWLRPLWLMSVNDALRPYTDVQLPVWLWNVKVSLRKALLVGLLDGHPRILDAWVAAHVESARERFAKKDTVRDREVHVAAPVVLDGKTAPSYGPADLRPAFGRQRVYLLISGEGGSGKTSLACQVAKWAMSADAAERVAGHLMLPVFLDEELPAESERHQPLLAAIRGGLQDLVDAPEPTSEELAERLLRRRRLLVIVDHLSETSAATRQAIQPSLPDFPVNAMVVTSRLDEPLGGVAKTVIRPLRIEGNRLSSFMEAYLMQRGKRELFTDSEYFEACRRLSLIVGARNVTALLAKLYAEQMISLKEEASASGLPDNIPELMLSYLNQVNRGASGNDPDDRTVQRDAKAIAWECLRRTYRPAQAKRNAALAALGGDGAESRLEYLETRLRLIQTVGAARDQIRFALDPLAEYLAALHLLRYLGEEPDLWRDFLAYADALPDAPAGIRGFLLATHDCIAVQGGDANVPAFVAAELERRIAAIDGSPSLSAEPPVAAVPGEVTHSNPPFAAQEG